MRALRHGVSINSLMDPPPPQEVHLAQATQVAKLAEMVADPCNSELIPGLYGSSSGMLARTKRSVLLPTAATDTAGYILWDPDYTTAPPDDPLLFPKTGNFVIWHAADSSQRPTNSTTEPYGSFFAGNTATFQPDPSHPLLATTLVADMRTLGACLQLTYTGTLLNSAGEIAVITNLPAQELLTGGAGSTPLTVDELFAYSPHKGRFTPETHEVKFKPRTSSSPIYRNEQQNMMQHNDGQVTAIPFSTRGFAPQVLGFAWRGMTPGSSLTYDVLKNVEWRAEASAGIGQTPVHHSGPSKAPIVNQILQSHPGYSQVSSTVRHQALQIANASGRALGSRAQQAISAAGGGLGSFLRQSLIGYAQTALESSPLLLGMV